MVIGSTLTGSPVVYPDGVSPVCWPANDSVVQWYR